MCKAPISHNIEIEFLAPLYIIDYLYTETKVTTIDKFHCIAIRKPKGREYE